MTLVETQVTRGVWLKATNGFLLFCSCSWLKRDLGDWRVEGFVNARVLTFKVFSMKWGKTCRQYTNVTYIASRRGTGDCRD